MKKKSLSAKKIIPRNLNFNKILKDKKIFEIYNKFEKNLDKIKKQSKIAASVSGGPDSLALCFLLSCYKFKKNDKIQPLFFLVDHRLRNNSQKEAIFVKKLLQSKKLDLKILKWNGKKPTSNIQNIARKKRYELLFKECKKLNIGVVLTGHHQDDIYETFFIRLLRGSGPEGLSSFVNKEKEFNFKKKKIKVIRPLLDLIKVTFFIVVLTSICMNPLSSSNGASNSTICCSGHISGPSNTISFQLFINSLQKF